MKELTKRRLKAYLIDFALSTAVTLAVERLLRKKIKNEWVHALMTPTVVQWGLEYAQLSCHGQTIGYKAMGLAVEDQNGFPLTQWQIWKRIGYRDVISTFDYLQDRRAFEGAEGSVFPHDRYAGTVVKDIDQV